MPASKPTVDLDRPGSGRGISGERVRLRRRRGPRILERTGLDRPAEEVLVDRERGRLRRGDRNAVGEGVVDLLVA